jgi:CTP:molybdopterin cytidylyltransferase MocA
MEEIKLAGLVLAGYSRDEEDLLAEYSQGGSKALIPIAGRPMVSYVLDALAGSRHVFGIVVVGLTKDECPAVSKSMEFVPDQGDLMANANAGIECARELSPDLTGVLASGSDIPLLTTQIVDEFVRVCMETDHDLYYGAIERSVMEGRFPTSKRTYLRLKEGDFAGGDLILLQKSAVMADQDLWARLADARKSPLRQAQMVGGFTTLFKLVTHRLGLEEGVQRVSKSLKIRARVVPFPYAEIGMDVDKPFQLEIARAELEAGAGVQTP